MVDNNTLSLKLDYYLGAGSGTTSPNGSTYPCSRAETDCTILYKIRSEAIPLLTAVENADIAEIVEDLIQKGIVFFFDEDNQSVSIKQVENVWAELKDSAASSNHTVSAEVSTNTAEGNVDETADETAGGNDNGTVDNDESAEDATEAENTEDTTSADSTATVVASEEGTPEESGCWDTALIILGSDVIGDGIDTQFIIELLRKRAIEAGKYRVEVFAAEEIDTDTNEAAETEPATESASEDIDEDNNENELVEAVANKVNTLLFIIREIFHIDAFDLQSLASSDDPTVALEQKKTRIEAMQALVDKKLFLVNTHKDVKAEGIMMGDGKRIIVKAGSRVSSDNRLPNQKGQTSSAILREKLIDDGVIVDGTFVSDYEFSSTSAAASVILGQSASGMTAWKDEAGRKLETLLGR